MFDTSDLRITGGLFSKHVLTVSILFPCSHNIPLSFYSLATTGLQDHVAGTPLVLDDEHHVG
jgi:hypothetical protein